MTDLENAEDLPKNYFKNVKDLKVKGEIFPKNFTKSLRGYPNYDDIKDPKTGKVIKKREITRVKG